MGTTSTLVTLDEYLNTSYEPDMDFVDGVLVRRNLGTQAHASLQLIVGSYLRQFRHSHGIQAFADGRLLVDSSAGRHRIPDIMAVAKPFHKGQVVVDVPVIVIEIKSPADLFDDIVDRCSDYEKLGVQNILVMDPENRRAWLSEHGNLRHLSGDSVTLRLPDRPAIEFPFASMFAELDEE